MLGFALSRASRLFGFERLPPRFTNHRHSYDFSFLYIFPFYGLAAVFRRLHEKHIIAWHDWTWFLPASRTS
jgi:hypothetical protein